MEDIISRPAREALGDTKRQCTATNRAGQRCRRAPIPGGFVCTNHGGKIPAVQKTARERLLAMVDPALDALLRALRTAPPCKTCGRTDADRDPIVLRAAQMVLDRTGHHAGLTLQVETPKPSSPEYFAWIPLERLEQMAAWHAEAKAAMERGEPEGDLPVLAAIEPAVDAEVIDDSAVRAGAPEGLTQ